MNNETSSDTYLSLIDYGAISILYIPCDIMVVSVNKIYLICLKTPFSGLRPVSQKCP